MSEDVLEILERNAWPGNVRELENLIERAVVFAKERVITRENLPAFLLAPEDRAAAGAETVEGDLNLKEQTLSFQKRLIETTLRRSKGVQKNAASMLGVKPTTLNEMIKRLGIDVSLF